MVLISIMLINSCNNSFTNDGINQQRINNNINNPSFLADINLLKSFIPTGIVVDTGEDSYVVFKAQQVAHLPDRSNAYNIGVYAKFTSKGSIVNAGPLYINNRTIMPAANNLYEYKYQDSTLTQGKSLYGTSVTVNVPGIDDAPTSSPLSPRVIIVPKELYPSTIALPKSRVDRSVNYPLTWNADANNQYGKVQITVMYYKGLSQYHTVNMPNSIANLYYTVTDNGSFTIPQTDLTRFPKGSFVDISIARISYIKSTNRVIYIGIVEAHTNPILVIDNLSCDPSRNISGPNLLCTSATYSLVSTIPPNANATWIATPSGIVTISGTGPNVTVTKVSAGNVTLTTNVVNCQDNLTTPLSKTIHAGGYGSGDYPVSGPTSTCSNQYVNFSTNTLPGATNYQWIYPTGDWAYLSGQGTPNLSLRTGNSSASIGVRVANACDAGGSPAMIFVQVSCGFAITTSPNPTSNYVDIAIVQNKSLSSETEQNKIYKILIIGEKGNIKKEFNYKPGISKTKINLNNLITGNYIIKAFNGKVWSEKQIIVVR